MSVQEVNKRLEDYIIIVLSPSLNVEIGESM
jgi:hypothetical protein